MQPLIFEHASIVSSMAGGPIGTLVGGRYVEYRLLSGKAEACKEMINIYYDNEDKNISLNRLTICEEIERNFLESQGSKFPFATDDC